jgi:hypothetical protein
MIARVSCNEFSSSYFRQGIPAIVQGALDSWRPGECWSPGYLAALANGRTVTVGVAKDGRYLFNQSTDPLNMYEYERQEIAFGEAVRTVLERQRGNRFYILQQSIPDKLPELARNLVVPQWIQAEHPDINLWLGSDTQGPLHYDYPNNFFAQLYGTKRFVIFSPQDTPHLYPYACDAAMAHCSHVDVNDPDLMTYPRFESASAFTFELQAGELLFLPSFWWHQVQGTGVSVSVNLWWPTRLSQFLTCPNAVRELYKMYRKDRLKEFGKRCLEPGEQNFLSAASLLLDRGDTWGAGMLALGAFDELSSSGQPRSKPHGCALSDLPGELKEACEDIVDTVPLSHRHRRVIQQIPAVAEMACYCDDARMEHARVAELIDAVEALGVAMRSI